MRLNGLGVVVYFVGAVVSSGPARAVEDLPLSTGEYEIRMGGERIGQEQFRVYSKKKRYRLEFTRTVYWPEPIRYEYDYELESSLEPRQLELRTTRGGNFTELKLERNRDNWRLEVKGRGRKKTKQQLGRRQDAVVDFDSLLFNSLVIQQLGLMPEQHRDVDAVVLTLPDLAGARVKQVYRRVADEELQTDILGKVQAEVYELDADGKTHRLWMAPSGIVLQAKFDRLGGEVELVLTRLKSRPGPWPPAME